MANAFKIVTDEDDGQFYIVDPDGEEGDWADESDIATIEWDGHMFFATNGTEFAGMKPGTVYKIGAAQVTEAEVYEESEAIDEEGEMEGETEEEADDGTEVED